MIRTHALETLQDGENISHYEMQELLIDLIEAINKIETTLEADSALWHDMEERVAGLELALTNLGISG